MSERENYSAPRGSFLPRALKPIKRSCLPVVLEEEPELDEVDEEEPENWIYIEHLRGGPGDLDPTTRKPTAETAVLSTAHIYEAGTENEVATAKVAADGKPVRVAVPVGMSSFDVVFDDDFGGSYEIAHQPYPNPFTDKTPEPTEEQIARLSSIRLV